MRDDTKTMRKIIFALAAFLLWAFASSCRFGAGWIYPKVVFTFSQKNEPPFSATKRLAAGEKFPQELQFLIDVAGNNFKYDFDIRVFTKKAYKSLFIKEISYAFEGETGRFLKNAKFILPKNVCGADEEGAFPYWVTDSAHYWTCTVFMKPANKMKMLPRVNFEKVFKKKKPWETFPFTLKIVYQFDDEDVKTLELEYDVHALEGKYVSPFMFL